ncbi:nuclease homologue [Tistlia consotensis]|uniref:Nuclease homologue n=1 Tax=Tistlia consotensis USBA 355 TaxID=560819 RepID=A0A1Y6CT73_9PROT|nr:thermonuclease family protein [Tistlia consotensis]SMF77521.1 nuclease homologue [Tistlia consotensis USBA 355]SNS21233.1 nuclease homologue [Tistlia consotensis]
MVERFAVRAGQIALAALLWGAAAGAGASETILGPVAADVVSVYDGDTLTVRAHVWLGTTVETAVRLRGVDAPEIRGKCESERAAAIRARDTLRDLVGSVVELRRIEADKYGGRVDADVFTDGKNVAADLVAAGLARPYDGGHRVGWCP